MEVELVKIQSEQAASQPANESLALLADFTVPTALNDIVGTDISIEELLIRVAQACNVPDITEEVGEPTVMLYGVAVAVEATTFLPTITGLKLAIDAITAKNGVTGYMVRLK